MAIICRALLLALLPVLAGAQTFPEYEWWWWGGAPAPAWTARFAAPGCIPSGTILSPGPTVLTVTRSDVQWVWNGSALVQCAASTAAVSANGIEVWGARTNYALQSSTSCVANAVQAPWALAGTPTCVSDAAVAPDGTTTMDLWTNTTNTHGFTQGLTTASSATFSYSAWVKKDATGPASLGVNCIAGLPSCTCSASDGSACSVTPGGTSCVATATAVGTAPIRVTNNVTCAGAITNLVVSFTPGQNSVSTGSAYFGGAQVEAAAYPGPYIPTTTAAVSRAATVASVPLPNLHGTNVWCVGQTLTHSASVTDYRMLYAGTDGAANTFKVAVTAGAAYFDVYDSGAVLRRISGAWAETGAATRIVLHNSNGTTAIYRDGVAVAGPTASSALWSASPAALTFGSSNAGTLHINGSVQNLKIRVNPSSWRDCN